MDRPISLGANGRDIVPGTSMSTFLERSGGGTAERNEGTIFLDSSARVVQLGGGWNNGVSPPPMIPHPTIHHGKARRRLRGGSDGTFNRSLKNKTIQVPREAVFREGWTPNAGGKNIESTSAGLRGGKEKNLALGEKIED